MVLAGLLLLELAFDSSLLVEFTAALLVVAEVGLVETIIVLIVSEVVFLDVMVGVKNSTLVVHKKGVSA